MSTSSDKSINDYTLLTVIGKTIYGKIVLAKQNSSQKVYAIKILKKKVLSETNKINNIFTQRNLLTEFNHPFIIKINSTFQDEEKFYFVQEYCPGGDLFSLLSLKQMFTEEQVKFYIAQIVLALEYIHKRDIVYRDLKPENILIDKEGYVKLTDFGLSKKLKKNQSNNFSIKGMPEYMAPQILNYQECSRAVDFWCLGSLIYQMLTGTVPFYSENVNQLYQSIKFQQFTHENEEVQLSKNCIDLLKKLFIKNPQQRFGMKDQNQVKRHPWFSGINWEAVGNKKYRAPFVPILESQDDTSYFCPQITEENVHSLTQYDESHSRNHFPDDGKFQGFQYYLDSEQDKSQTENQQTSGKQIEKKQQFKQENSMQSST